MYHTRCRADYAVATISKYEFFPLEGYSLPSRNDLRLRQLWSHFEMSPIPKSKLAKRHGKQSSTKSLTSHAQPHSNSKPSPLGSCKRRAQSEAAVAEEADTELVYDDPYGDDYEEETVETAQPSNLRSNNADKKKSMRQAQLTRPVVFRPGKHHLAEGETLICDETAYDVFYKCNVEWPCLSFDFIGTRNDGQFDNLTPTQLRAYPFSISLVLGTQANTLSNNKLVFARMTNLHRNRRKRARQPGRVDHQKDDSSDDESASDETEDEANHDADADSSDLTAAATSDVNGILQSSDVKADATINRVRVMPQHPNIVAYWMEIGRVTLVDGMPALNTLYLDSRARMQAPSSILPSSIKPFYSTRAHRVEGFALDWSRVTPGRLLSGSVDGAIYLSQCASENASTWITSPDRFRGHRQSVEDIQWSPSESDVFASCSVDKSIRIWDAREYRRPALGIGAAHDTDVNVISWNRNETHLLASGGDDGVIKVWDLRSLQRDAVNKDTSPAAEFALHQQPITSIQWHPVDASMLCASSEDGSVSIWDLAVERDAEEEIREGVVIDGAEELPPQLLFIHMGQTNVKEAHWHPACPSLIVSTAEDGLNIFQPSNIALPT